jgi:uncharacterized Tic20 family protein
MEVKMNNKPGTNERLMAAIAHGSIVANGLGILVGTLIWLTQKEKSPYAARQGLQAAVYQLLGMIVIVVSWVLWGVFHGLTYIPIIIDERFQTSQPPAIFFISLAAMVVPFLIMFVWGFYGLWAALQTWLGRDFHYALIGKRLASK